MDGIVLEPLKGKRWKVYKDIDYTLSNGVSITIPKGFITDLSSVPRFLWGVMSPYGDFLLAALVHDYLYVQQSIMTRKEADKEMLIISNKINSKTRLNKFDNRLRYLGVRAFGWIYWKYVDL